MGLTWEGDQRNIGDLCQAQDHATHQVLSRSTPPTPEEAGPGWHAARKEAQGAGDGRGWEDRVLSLCKEDFLFGSFWPE